MFSTATGKVREKVSDGWLFSFAWDRPGSVAPRLILSQISKHR
jgi:hypothetical protein